MRPVSGSVLLVHMPAQDLLPFLLDCPSEARDSLCVLMPTVSVSSCLAIGSKRFTVRAHAVSSFLSIGSKRFTVRAHANGRTGIAQDPAQVHPLIVIHCPFHSTGFAVPFPQSSSGVDSFDIFWIDSENANRKPCLTSNKGGLRWKCSHF